MADVSILHFSSFGGGTFFGSIGSFFSGIGKFFENLCKDPLKTLMAIGSAILTAVSVGAAAPFLVNMIGDLALTMIFASTAAVAIGFDLQWLQAALAIFGFIVCAYNWTIGWSQYSSSLVNLLGLGKDAAQMLTELSIVYRLVVVAVAAYLTMSLLTSIRDGVTLAQGMETAAGELAEIASGAVGAVTGGVIGGLIDGLTGTPGGQLLLVGGTILTIWLLSDDSPSTIVKQPNEPFKDQEGDYGYAAI